ncbi:hypothetical protein OA39_01625 [Vibrio campbellii]|jgi:hypothetical protein|nr:hypothetical protein Vca1114GL_04961 [Vibrio campbellii]ARR08315.1 hypothetical protein Vc3S01_A0342 [Vibrio campbellii]EDL70970.1 hypothetical protein A1Q_1884 [Vibrio campbellii HY01]ELU51805.1 hypothetical protein B878_11253 [Vibrio campbellii CAIM 519 = NBRC 15631 = ATCC 25920]KGR36522.1 hypothetical protein OA39_01625 [Vibrio campbellii]
MAVRSDLKEKKSEGNSTPTQHLLAILGFTAGVIFYLMIR